MAGTKFNSTYQVILEGWHPPYRTFKISQEELTELITSRHCVCRFTPIAESAASISRIDCTQKTSYLLSSSCISLYKIKNKQLDNNSVSPCSCDKTKHKTHSFPATGDNVVTKLGHDVLHEFGAERVALRVEPADQRWVNGDLFGHLKLKDQILTLHKARIPGQQHMQESR